jgi:hypothetical protein
MKSSLLLQKKEEKKRQNSNSLSGKSLPSSPINTFQLKQDKIASGSSNGVVQMMGPAVRGLTRLAGMSAVAATSSYLSNQAINATPEKLKSGLATGKTANQDIASSTSMLGMPLNFMGHLAAQKNPGNATLIKGLGQANTINSRTNSLTSTIGSTVSAAESKDPVDGAFHSMQALGNLLTLAPGSGSKIHTGGNMLAGAGQTMQGIKETWQNGEMRRHTPDEQLEHDRDQMADPYMAEYPAMKFGFKPMVGKEKEFQSGVLNSGQGITKTAAAAMQITNPLLGTGLQMISDLIGTKSAYDDLENRGRL